MKKLIFGLFVLALCAGPASANSIGIFGSYYAPADASSELGLGVDFEFGQQVEFEIRWAGYDYLVTDPKPEVFRVRAYPLDMGVNYNFGGGSKVTPYFGGGLTYITFDFDTDATRTTGQPRGAGIDPEFELYVQFGLDFQINTNWKAYSELVLRTVEAEIESDDLGTPLDQRLDMNGVALNLGLAVQW